MIEPAFAIYFWGFLLLYGTVMYAISPQARTVSGFFGGTDAAGGTNRARSFDFNVFASELFNSITVRKSASAGVEEGALGATIDMQTALPFDYEGFTLAASAQGHYNDLSDTIGPRGAFLISNRWGDFGALVSVAVMLALIYVGLHIATTLAFVSFVGVWVIKGNVTIALNLLWVAAYDSVHSYVFAAIPTFVLMGFLVAAAGMGRDAATARRARPPRSACATAPRSCAASARPAPPRAPGPRAARGRAARGRSASGARHWSR